MIFGVFILGALFGAACMAGIAWCCEQADDDWCWDDDDRSISEFHATRQALSAAECN